MKRRCLNCMEEFLIEDGREAVNYCCPFCGFIENTPPDNVIYLPTGVLLNDRYLLGTVIGAGGFGITYKAWDNVFDCGVAIKEYYPRGIVSRTETKSISIYSGEEQDFNHGKERFLKEARNLAKFNSNPHIVSIQDYFEANGTAYLVMEYLSGCNLKEYIKYNNRTMPFYMVENMTSLICDVLTNVHAAGIIHRDISPDNIYLCDDGVYKLIDFGASKISATETNLSTTVFLKRGYAPIEQYSKNGKIGPWTDIYALSATVYYLLSGIIPPDSIDRLDSDSLEPLIKVLPQIPKSFNDAIMKGLAVQVVNRYQTIEEFKKDLFYKPVNQEPPVKKEPPLQPVSPVKNTRPVKSVKNNDRLYSRLFAAISIFIVLLTVPLYEFCEKSDLGTFLTSFPVMYIIIQFDTLAFISDRNLKGFELPIGIGTIFGCCYLIVLSSLLPYVLENHTKLSNSFVSGFTIFVITLTVIVILLSLFSIHWAYSRTKNPSR